MEERIGSVFKFSTEHPSSGIKLDFGDLAVRDIVRVKGAATDFTQKISDLEFDHKPVLEAARGRFTGIKISHSAKPFDLVYKVTR